MSYLIDGFPEAGIEVSPLLRLFAGRFGPAIATMGTPVEGLLVDRRVLGWEDLISEVETWVRDQGHASAIQVREQSSSRGLLVVLEFE
jgi:hypothetical protein